MKICPLCRREYKNVEAGFCPYDQQPLVEKANLAVQSQRSPTNVVSGATAERIAQPFSASLAMAFFPHHFVEVLPPDSGDSPPCQPNINVSTYRLSYELPTIAFWYLRENNYIRFAPGVQSGFFSNHTALVIEVNRSQQTSIPGLEYDFLEIIKGSPPGVTIEAVVKKFLYWKTPFPESKFTHKLTEWMIQLGYGQPDTSKPFFSFGNKPGKAFELVPDCHRIASQEQAAQIIHRSWMKFRAEQPEIFYYLFEAVQRAINERCTKGRERF